MRYFLKNFYNYLKRNLIGFATNGANVMRGYSNGLISHFEKYVNNPIYAIHCLAHRLHLAIEKSFKKVPYLKQFE